MGKKLVSKKAEVEGYIKEMTIWIQQKKARLESCKISIEECNKQLEIIRRLKNLEKAQAAIIRRNIRRAEKILKNTKGKG